MNAGVAPARLTLLVLVVDGFITALLEVLYLPIYVGSVAFPVAALFAAVINLALVFGAARVTGRPAIVGIPLLAWLIGFVLCLLPTSGGSVLLAANESGRILVLLACGMVPAFALFTRYRIRGLHSPWKSYRGGTAVAHRRSR